MRRKRKQDLDESLDLLLDTITNTFGGLIFIAILIALLVGDREPLATKDKRENDSNQDENLKLLIQQAKDEIESRRLQEIQNEKFNDRFSTTEQKTLFRKLKSLESTLKSTTSDLSAKSKEKEVISGESDNMALQLSELAQLMSDRESEVQQLNRQLDNEKDKRTTDIDAPKQKATTKESFSAIITRDRFYILVDRSGNLNFHKSDDFQKAVLSNAEVSHASFGSFKTKESGGIPLTDTQAIQKKLSSFDPDDYYIGIAIFEDSFGQFHRLRDLLVSRKYEYQLVPMKMKSIVGFGGKNTKVQ